MRSLLGKLMKPDPRECEETRALLSDYVDGSLGDDSRRRVERHVRFCPRCHTVLGNLRVTLVRLRGIVGAHPVEDDEVVAERVSRAWRDRL